MYNNDKIADKTFGINVQARAVLEVLAETEPDFAEHKDHYYQVQFNTYPWYNGRERGIIITMCPEFNTAKKFLNIAIFEHRNSDSLCCLKWETENFYWNHPLEDAKIFDKAYPTGSKYDVAKSFPYMEIRECAKWVYDTFAEFYRTNHKYAEVEVSK